jgi:hypothetical protein
MLSVQAEKHQSYLNSLWLIAVTFLSIGYGLLFVSSPWTMDILIGKKQSKQNTLTF